MSNTSSFPKRAAALSGTTAEFRKRHFVAGEFPFEPTFGGLFLCEASAGERTKTRGYVNDHASGVQSRKAQRRSRVRRRFRNLRNRAPLRGAFCGRRDPEASSINRATATGHLKRRTLRALWYLRKKKKKKRISGATGGTNARNGERFENVSTLRGRWRSGRRSSSKSRSFQMTGGGSERSSLASGKSRHPTRLEKALYRGVPARKKTFQKREAARTSGTKNASALRGRQAFRDYTPNGVVVHITEGDSEF